MRIGEELGVRLGAYLSPRNVGSPGVPTALLLQLGDSGVSVALLLPLGDAALLRPLLASPFDTAAEASAMLPLRLLVCSSPSTTPTYVGEISEEISAAALRLSAPAIERLIVALGIAVPFVRLAQDEASQGSSTDSHRPDEMRIIGAFCIRADSMSC